MLDTATACTKNMAGPQSTFQQASLAPAWDLEPPAKRALSPGREGWGNTGDHCAIIIEDCMLQSLRGEGGGDGDCHMRRSGMLVVPLGGQNLGGYRLRY